MLKFFLLASLVCAIIPVALACEECSSPFQGMCCDIPSNNQYILTTFCDGGGDCSTSCGIDCCGASAFSADRQRFGCNATLNVCNSGNTCMSITVIDAGPGDWVEQQAGMPIIDASQDVCQNLFGSSSCGWSDGNTITAVMSERPASPFPFKVTPEEMQEMIREGNRLMKELKRDPTAKCRN